MELPIRFAPIRCPMNRQVNPFAGRGSFKFKITIWLTEISCDKKLADVPIPQSHGLFVCLRIRADDEWPRLGAKKTNNEGLRRPYDSRFSMSVRRCFFARPVASEVDH